MLYSRVDFAIQELSFKKVRFHAENSASRTPAIYLDPMKWVERIPRSVSVDAATITTSESLQSLELWRAGCLYYVSFRAPGWDARSKERFGLCDWQQYLSDRLGVSNAPRHSTLALYIDSRTDSAGYRLVAHSRTENITGSGTMLDCV